jgi:3-oxoacyl-[acyl-carrier protein] reductase
MSSASMDRSDAPGAAGALNGRVALVTGAVGALGTAVARALAADGAVVAVHHLGQAAEARTLAGELQAGGGRAAPFEADVADWDQVTALIAAVERDLGSVDILVNNAGVMEEKPFVETSPADWARTIDVDLTGVFACCRAVVPGMLAGDGGAIVNVSSQLAARGAPNTAAYCAAKAGVLGLTRALARELGPRIRINAVAPGPLETPLVEPYATPEWRAQRTSGLVVGRLGRPEEVAPVVAFLVSDHATLFHGQTLHANGGGVM